GEVGRQPAVEDLAERVEVPRVDQLANLGQSQLAEHQDSPRVVRSARNVQLRSRSLRVPLSRRARRADAVAPALGSHYDWGPGRSRVERAGAMARFRFSVRSLMIGVPILGLVASGGTVVAKRGLDARDQERCAANLAAIGQAFHDYHNRYGHF